MGALSLLAGWLFDLLLGDPRWLPHPVVGFGHMISFGEHRLNKGSHRRLKGALLAVFLITFVFFLTCLIRHALSLLPWGTSVWMLLFDAVIVFIVWRERHLSAKSAMYSLHSTALLKRGGGRWRAL